MPGGRPTTAKRPPFGERLHQAREQRGLSQSQMADKLGVTQQSYAAWERRPVALKPEQITELCSILEVPAEALVGKANGHARKGGPVGKARLMFEQVSKLPHHQQKKILEVVQALVTQQSAG